MNRPILPLLALPMLVALLPLASGNAQAVTCQGNVPPSNPDLVYVDNEDGTVTDLRSGLMWKQCVQGRSGSSCGNGTVTTMTWAAALAAAQASTFAGYSDWRLPNIRELQSLVEVCHTYPAINDAYFPNDPSWYVWSGSPFPALLNHAWHVGFFYGDALGAARNDSNVVRLVRSGQSFADLIFESGFDGSL